MDPISDVTERILFHIVKFFSLRLRGARSKSKSLNRSWKFYYEKPSRFRSRHFLFFLFDMSLGARGRFHRAFGGGAVAKF